MASPKQPRAKPGQGAGPGQGAKPGQGAGPGPGARARRGTVGNPGGSTSAGRVGQQGRNANVAGQARPPAGQARPGPKAQSRPAAQPERAAIAMPARPGAPRWLQLTTLILSLGGLCVSIYLTIAHYNTSVTLACPDTGLVNCAKVTTSTESVVFGIFPVAVLGLAFYVFMVGINTPWAWKSRLPAVYWARLASVIVGMVFVLYLVYAEIIEIGNICLWCTSVHVITFVMFALLVFHASSPTSRTSRQAPALR